MPEIDKHRTSPDDYNIPRYGHARRKLSIVNPINQLRVADIISDNWRPIRDRLSRSNASEFDPKITRTGQRAVNGVDFEAVSTRRAEIFAKYGRYVKTDIARFYSSIYTHSIVWSLLGKDYYKENYKDPAVKSSFANSLDSAVAAGQQGQTSGIPIGPDTSRIISELIATEVEMLTASRGLGDLSERSVRYVDDMIIGIGEAETPEAVLRHFNYALYEYELELSAEKTSMHGVGHPHAPEWVGFVMSFKVAASGNRQRADLDSYFDQLVYLADQNPRENVMLYGAKRAASFVIDDANVDHLVNWLLYCARRSASCLSFVAEHLAALGKIKDLPAERISEFVFQQLIAKSAAAQTHEVAWLLFWAREAQLTLPEEVAKSTTGLRSSVVAIATLDLNQAGRVTGNVDFSYWSSFANSQGLKSPMWLASYELSKKGWWPRQAQSVRYVTSDKYFGDLWTEDVWFYDVRRTARLGVTPSFDAPPASAFDIGFGQYPI